MRRKTDDQPASRVVEEPKRSALPYFAVAAVAAIAVWSIQQDSIQDSLKQQVRNLSKETPEKRGALGARGDIRTLFSADDYPADAQRNGEEGTVQAELAVDSKGRVTGCTIVRSSGHASLDETTCSILQRRARFTPARDANGEAIPDSVVTPPVVWRLEG
jgi:protein TonB